MLLCFIPPQIRFLLAWTSQEMKAEDYFLWPLVDCAQIQYCRDAVVQEMWCGALAQNVNG